MKRSKVIATIGGIIIALGLIGLAWGVQPTSAKTTETIPAGAGYYVYVKVSGWMSGQWSGDFTSDTGAVDLMILDASQFAEYSYNLQPSGNLFSITNSAGHFSADLPSTGTYYLVINHASGYESSAQSVTVDHKVSGIDLVFLIGGIALLVVGAVVLLFSMRMKAKEPVDVLARPPAADVVMFDEKPKPPT